MALKEELAKEIKQIFQSPWDTQDATVIPEPEDLTLNKNHGKNLKEATVLYADIDGSTNMVELLTPHVSAEVYKTYLRCASQIIKSEGGTISAFDGDRVMGVFIGDSKNTSAVRAAMKINFAVIKMIRPALIAQYPHWKDFVLKHVIGIDTSALFVVRTGVHGDNDLVWVGRAANYAAKLCTLSEKPLWITNAVYDHMHDEAKLSSGVNMWERRVWTAMNKMEIYCSTYHWDFG